jgi:hypothetical protein
MRSPLNAAYAGAAARRRVDGARAVDFIHSGVSGTRAGAALAPRADDGGDRRVGDDCRSGASQKGDRLWGATSKLDDVRSLRRNQPTEVATPLFQCFALLGEIGVAVINSGHT